MSSSFSLKLSVRSKKAHEQRFYGILIALSDDEIEWKFFREALRFLCVSELDEIVEERTCKDKCGYILCNKLNNIHPTAAVSLDIPRRKIYDISNRKKFCSDWCYAAYKHINDQISVEPIWKSQFYGNKEFALYPEDGEGCAGELYFEEDQVTIENEFIKEASPNAAVLKNTTNSSNNILPNKRIDQIQNVIEALDNLVVKSKKKKTIEELIQQVKVNSEKNHGRKIVVLDEVIDDKDYTSSPTEKEALAVLEKVTVTIVDWITDTTRDFLMSTDNNKGDNESANDEDGENVVAEGSGEGRDELLVSYPVVDSMEQMKSRRNILMRRVKSCDVAILGDFGLEKNDFVEKFEKFINTCRLTSKNVFFTVKEFKWLTILLIDIMSSKLKHVNLVNRETILKKHGLQRISLYEKKLENISKLVYGDTYMVVSSQGDIKEL